MKLTLLALSQIFIGIGWAVHMWWHRQKGDF
jgi:hypothetical protein